MQNKYQFQFTPLALQDIDDAMMYISGQLANPTAASDLYAALERAIDHICTFPYAYANCSSYLIMDENIRHIRVGNYILIYEVIKDSHTIRILRFRYCAMDFSQIHLK